MCEDHRWMDKLMGDCQVLAGRFSGTSPAALMAEINGLWTNLPSSLSRTEQLIIGGVLGQFLARFARQAGMDSRADVMQGFLNLADAGTTFDRWRRQWFHVAECCGGVRGDDADTCPLELIDV